jgi:spore maturation protein CgeB
MFYQNLYRIEKAGISYILFWILELFRLAIVAFGNRRGNMCPMISIFRRVAPILWPDINMYQKILLKKRQGFSSSCLLIIGQLNYGSTSWSRTRALKRIFNKTESLDITPFLENLSLLKHILINHFYSGKSICDINRLILKKTKEFKPDILWVDKCLYLWPETLENIRKESCSLLIHFSPDNQIVRTNQSRHYLRSIPIYDMHITTKKHNIDWLLKCGARRVEYIINGFDPDVHRPLVLNQDELKIFGCDIGFIGRWEPSREDILLWLFKKGYNIKVWGGNWSRSRYRNHLLFAHSQHLVGDDYTKAICGAKINLCLLSKWHNDLTTDRSVEIPACGKFMLAERNNEHLALFKEGIEAEFYDTQREMLEKIEYYLKHEYERENIASAGRKRCLADYSNKELLKEILVKIL